MIKNAATIIRNFKHNGKDALWGQLTVLTTNPPTSDKFFVESKQRSAISMLAKRQKEASSPRRHNFFRLATVFTAKNASGVQQMRTTPFLNNWTSNGV